MIGDLISMIGVGLVVTLGLLSVIGLGGSLAYLGAKGAIEIYTKACKAWSIHEWRKIKLSQMDR